MRNDPYDYNEQHYDPYDYHEQGYDPHDNSEQMNNRDETASLDSTQLIDDSDDEETPLFDTALALEAIQEKDKKKLELALTCKPPFEYKNHESFASRLFQFAFETSDLTLTSTDTPIEKLLKAKQLDRCNWLIANGLSANEVAAKAAELQQTIYAETLRLTHDIAPDLLFTTNLPRKNAYYFHKLQVLHLTHGATHATDMTQKANRWHMLQIPVSCSTLTPQTITKAQNALTLAKHFSLSNEQACYLVSENLWGVLTLLASMIHTNVQTNNSRSTNHNTSSKVLPFDINIWGQIFEFALGIQNCLTLGTPRYVKNSWEKLPLIRVGGFFASIATTPEKTENNQAAQAPKTKATRRARPL